MDDRMMHVLHVSSYESPGEEATRVVLGCEDMAYDVEGKLLELGYCVWRTFEPNPHRSAAEVVAAQDLLVEVVK